MKAKRHTVLLTVTFDKPCTRKLALREVRDTIHGTTYCTQYKDSEPGEYKVGGIYYQRIEALRDRGNES
jgi:hypothetical protein